MSFIGESPHVQLKFFKILLFLLKESFNLFHLFVVFWVRNDFEKISNFEVYDVIMI